MSLHLALESQLSNTLRRFPFISAKEKIKSFSSMILASTPRQGTTVNRMSLFKIAVCGRKGGVGKTTTATALASFLSYHGTKVLVIDLDPQSNAGFVLGVDPVAPGAAELIKKESPVPLQASENLYVLPGGAALQDRVVEQADPEELSFAIKGLANFEVMIFDCPPGIDTLERQALIASNVALVCTNAHPLGLLGADRVVADIKYRQMRKQAGPNHYAFVLTQVNKSRALDKGTPGSLAKDYPDIPLFSIGQNSDLAWATASQTPFMDVKPNTRAIADVEALARWIFLDTVTKGLNNG